MFKYLHNKEALAEVSKCPLQMRGKQDCVKLEDEIGSDCCPKRSGKVSPLLGSTEGEESNPDGVMTRSPQGGWHEKIQGKLRHGGLQSFR